MKDHLDIAVMSDLHCKYGANLTLVQTQTYLTTDLELLPISKHPVEALKKCITDFNLSADLLLCPGDITDKVDKQGLLSGWNFIKEVQQSIGNPKLFATVGNHDIDSRGSHSTGHPFTLLKQLEVKGYPTSDSFANTSYWSNHFCVICDSDYCLLLFNSCYSHTDANSAKSCLIDHITIEKINEELSKVSELDMKFKICMLHHHPQHHSNFDLQFSDADFVENGDRLVALLNKFDFNIVIHGHKHEPKLRYDDTIPVFASGSFSSLMNIIDIKADNTFHMIRLERSGLGTIRSWVYGPTKGWTQSDGTYFPCTTGFGAKKSPREIADDCEALISVNSSGMINYQSLIQSVPDLPYLVPSEQDKLIELLSAKGLSIYPSIKTNPKLLLKSYT